MILFLQMLTDQRQQASGLDGLVAQNGDLAQGLQNPDADRISTLTLCIPCLIGKAQGSIRHRVVLHPVLRHAE